MNTIDSQYKKLKRDALKSVKQHFKKMNLEWYSSGFVDGKHPTGRLQLAHIDPPVVFKHPEFHEADADGYVRLSHVSKKGLQCGMLSFYWNGLTLEFLAKLDAALTKYNKRHGNV